jgi:SAM-dependent methyltransferase
MNDAEDLAASKERSWREVAAIDEALAAGRLDRQGWHEAMLGLIEGAYLAGNDPRAQSGYSGDEERWRQARGLLVDALPASGGTFLDVGCANGHLMRTLTDWAGAAGKAVEPHGVEISAPLAGLARAQQPQWADRIWCANAFGWTPPRRFEVVRTGLDYVPAAFRGDYLRHLLEHVVAPGGRLIVGAFNEETEQDTLERQVAGLGHRIAGRTTAAHRHPAVSYKAFWIENQPRTF